MANQTERMSVLARNLRKQDTVAEQKLWEALRNRRLQGMKFVRQLPIGPYIADFACRETRLIVEVDGVTHGTAAELAIDAKREDYLRHQGWAIVRCWNQDVYTDISGVCDSILIAAGRG